MAAPIILQPGLCQVRTQYSPNPDTGDIFENILWFQSATHTSPTVANLTAMAGVFDPAWGNVYKQVSSTSKSYMGSIWTDYSSAVGNSYTSVGTFTAVPGLVGGGIVPPNSCWLISMKNGERFRGGHFRIYMPWIGFTAVNTSDPSMLNASGPANATTAFAAVNVATTGSGVLGGQTQVLYRSRTKPGLAQLYPITSFTVQLKIATQRRRLRKAPHH